MPPRSSRHRALPRTAHHLPSSPGSGLRRQVVPERLAALELERDRLLKKIALKKRDIEALERRMAEATRILAGTQSVRDEAIALDRELHRLFAELLARKRQPRHTRRMVAFVYQMLRDSGVVSFHAPDGDPEDDADDLAGEEGDPFRPGEAGAGHAGAPHRPPAGGGGFSARRPSDAAEDQSLRGVFRRLAMAIHPDRVPDEGEKVRRTELMKEISRAYQERDLARLLHLERAWMSEREVVPAGDEPSRRCAALERTNRALATQLSGLGQALKELRRSPAAALVKDVRRAARGNPDPLAALIAEASAEVAQAREVRDFVASFRDGKITLDEFVLGPASLRRSSPKGRTAGDEAELEKLAFAELMTDLFDGAGGGPPRRGRGQGKRRSRSGRRSGDLPF